TPQRFTSTETTVTGVSKRLLLMVSAVIAPDDSAPIELYVYTRPNIEGGAWAFQAVAPVDKPTTYFAVVEDLVEAEYEVAIGAQSDEAFTLGEFSLAVLTA